MSILDQNDNGADAAVGYTDEFFDAAVRKIDAAFGAGFARANPALVGALVQASATNLAAFMTAAAAIDPSMYDDIPEEFLDPEPPKAAKKPKALRGRP